MRLAGAACGLTSQVRTGALRGGGQHGAAGGGPRRGPRHLHCVMGPVRQLRRHRRRTGAERPGRRGLGPAGLPRPRAARLRWGVGVGASGRSLVRPAVGAVVLGLEAGAGARAGGAGAGAAAGGRGRAGGGPRRPALPAAAILLSEEEEEEAAAAGPAARPAWVSPGLAWWPWRRCPRGGFGLSRSAHVGWVRRALPRPRRLGPARAGAARLRPHFLTFPGVPGALRRTRLVPRRRLPLNACPATGPWGE